MKKVFFLICLGIFLVVCSCGNKGDVRVIELKNGQYAVQIKDRWNDWAWFTNDGSTYSDITWALRHGNGIRTFDNEKEACAYKEKIEADTGIERIVKCE